MSLVRVDDRRLPRGRGEKAPDVVFQFPTHLSPTEVFRRVRAVRVFRPTPRLKSARSAADHFQQRDGGRDPSPRKSRPGRGPQPRLVGSYPWSDAEPSDWPCITSYDFLDLGDAARVVDFAREYYPDNPACIGTREEMIRDFAACRHPIDMRADEPERDLAEADRYDPADESLTPEQEAAHGVEPERRTRPLLGRVPLADQYGAKP
jgi:hypothetical protein